jgi:hypothetical protein
VWPREASRRQAHDRYQLVAGQTDSVEVDRNKKECVALTGLESCDVVKQPLTV